MLVRQLAYLTALAREGHFARAAASCGVSQPTLSAGIRTLEGELGVAIVRRGRRFVGLTPEGERVLGWGRRMLADLDGLRQDLSELKAGLAGRLRLGVVPAALPVVPPLTEPLLDAHPQVAIEVRSMSSAAIQLALERFEIDAAVTYLDNEPLRQVRTLPLYRERYLLATADPGAFPGREAVTWAEVAACRLCLLSPAMQNRRIIDAALTEAGAPAAAPRVEADSHLVLAGYVRTGRWATVFPHTYRWLAAGAAPGVRLLPVGGPDRSHAVGLVRLDREPAPPLVRALLGVARRLDPPVDRALAPPPP